MSISDEKYVLTATFRKSGEPVTTTTWITALDSDRVGFWTSSAAGKTKRLRNNPRVTMQPCDARDSLTLWDICVKTRFPTATPES